MRNLWKRIKSLFYSYAKPMKETAIFIGFVVLLMALFVLIVNINIVSITEDDIFTAEELQSNLNSYDCVLILGAGVRSDGSPTPMLNDRLITGYQASVNSNTSVIFISGDSENSDYTETVTMKNVLIEMGVSENNIISDGYGLSTYESIWRAKNIYGFDKILIVSQKYHLHRAIFIAEKLGMDADGVDAALQGYAKQPIYDAREALARLKDMLYIAMMPQPNYTQKWQEGAYE